MGSRDDPDLEIEAVVHFDQILVRGDHGKFQLILQEPAATFALDVTPSAAGQGHGPEARAWLLLS